MSGATILEEIAAGLREAGAETGDGELLLTITRAPSDAPTTPWGDAAEEDPDTFEVAGVVTSYARRYIDGEFIRATDRRVLIEAGVVVPTVADTVTIGGAVYKIITVTPTAPGGVDLMYELQARA